VFLEYAIEARFRYLDEHGFSGERLCQGTSPSTRSVGRGKDGIIYKRELHVPLRRDNKAGRRNLIVSRIMKAAGGLAAD
jgi:hypothetical protein